MPMIRRAHAQGIDGGILHQFAKIGKCLGLAALCLGDALQRSGQSSRINLRNAYNLHIFIPGNDAV